MAARRPRVAASFMCSSYRNSEFITSPSILSLFLGMIFWFLIIYGFSSVRSGGRVKCMMTVLSSSNVAPLRLSHSNALSMTAYMPARLASAVGPVTQAEYTVDLDPVQPLFQDLCPPASLLPVLLLGPCAVPPRLYRSP
ncbi:Uncharacterized protein HZ326_29279 [Fusarium oxysporum f. sp. albedinis]|nr:Uncharacterized protein HZ326_29279 [Fusarium oxysporum f. sp. albedinis]